MGQVTGIAIIKANGAIWRALPGAKLDIGGFDRDAVTGHKLYGFKNKFKEATLTCDIAHMADSGLVALNALTGATIEFDCDSGVSYVSNNAFCSKTPELTGSDGKYSVEFKGDPAVEA